MSLYSVLKDMRWTDYEARAYDALLKNGAVKALDLASKADIPAGRIHTVLKALKDRGAVRQAGGHGAPWVALSPKDILEGHVHMVKERTEGAMAEAEALFERMHGARDAATPKLWTAHGEEEIAEQVRRLVDGAAERISIMAPPGALRKQLRKRLQQACEREVTVDALATASDEAALRDLAAHGAECHTVESAPFFLLAVDGQLGVVALEGPDCAAFFRNAPHAEMLEDQHAALRAEGKAVEVTRLDAA